MVRRFMMRSLETLHSILVKSIRTLGRKDECGRWSLHSILVKSIPVFQDW